MSVFTAILRPGDKTPLDTHRHPVTVYVLEGAFTLEMEGRAPVRVTEGEPPNVKMTGYNRSTTDPIKLVVIYVGEPDTPFTGTAAGPSRSDRRWVLNSLPNRLRHAFYHGAALRVAPVSTAAEFLAIGPGRYGLHPRAGRGWQRRAAAKRCSPCKICMRSRSACHLASLVRANKIRDLPLCTHRRPTPRGSSPRVSPRL